MSGIHGRNAFKAALLILPLLGLSGCIEYTIDTTLNPDGSGLRKARIEATNADELAEYNLSTGDFTDLLFLGEQNGWSHETHVDDGDTTHVFQRETRVSGLTAWSRLNDDLRISGALPSKSASTIGYVTLGNVQFRNRVLVGSSRRSDGSSSFSYLETLSWEDGVDALLEVIVQQMDRYITDAFPALSAMDRGEILGLARARLWEAVEDGVLDSSGDDEDEMWSGAVDRTVDQAIRVVRKQYPDAEEEALRAGLDVFSGEAEEEFLQGLVETLPGLNLAINSEVSFRLTMPGRITNTNAHEQDGNTLIWEFAPTDGLTAPIVILAESVAGG